MKISKRQMRQILESSYDYDQDYVMHPTDYVRGAMSLLSPEEFNGIGIEKMMREGEVAAMELRSNWPEDEGFGSSDRTYELQSFLEMLGFKTGFPNGTLEVVREGKMKITKRQLKRIIKEEKAALLSENGPIQSAERSLGLYADVSDVDGLTDSLLNILQGVELSAAEDGLDDEMAEAYAADAALLAVAQAFQAAGMMAEYQALYRMIGRG